MSTGPEHYKEAERLLDGAQSQGVDLLEKFAQGGSASKLGVATDVVANMLAAAQVHATLALAAATAATHATAYDGDEDHSRSRGWAGVA